MKIVSWNVNGIRALHRKGELEVFLKLYDPDILLIQEIKAQKKQLQDIVDHYQKYEIFWHSAEKAGYSGTGVFIRRDLGLKVQFERGMNNFVDYEGRIINTYFSLKEESFVVVDTYFPNGGKSPEAWKEKLIFYEKFLEHVNILRQKKHTVIWAGDLNCAHEEMDLAHPKGNDGKIGFHPAERAAISKFISNNWVDIFRHLNPNTVVYSWWHVITRARSRNIGWRIDYFFCDKAFLPKIKKIEYLTEQMGSDHCPVYLEI